MAVKRGLRHPLKEEPPPKEEPTKEEENRWKRLKKKWGQRQERVKVKLYGTDWQSRSLRAIIVIIFVALSFFHPEVKPLQNFILSTGVPHLADYWSELIIIGFLIVIGVAVYVALYQNSIVAGGGWAIMVLILVAGFSYGEEHLESAQLNAYILSFQCTMSNFGKPSTEWQDCSIQPIDITGEPEPEKIGSYKVLDVSFDTKYVSNVIYKSGVPLKVTFDTYFPILLVENPSDTMTIDDFKIITNSDPTDPDYSEEDYLYEEDTAIIRGGAVESEYEIKLANLYEESGMCMDDDGCHIGPKETLRLVLKAVPIKCEYISDEFDCEARDVCEWNETKCEEDDDTKTTEVDVKVKYSYNYSGEGKYDFIVAESDEVLGPKLASRKDPTSSDGPLDVIVYFAPSAYVFRAEPTEEKFFNVIIKLSKEKAGTAYIKEPIRISRLSDGILTKPAACRAPWVEDLTLDENTEVEYSENLWLGGERSLKESHTYVCKYQINYDKLNKDPEKEEDETIPFIVMADYRHEKTITQGSVPVVKI